MIHKPSQEQLAERFQRIPVELRKAIASNANGDKIFEIAKKYDLMVDKTGELAAETGLLILGVTHPNEFVGNLAERLQVNRETASKIADDINREIFAPVREHLRAQFGIAPAPGGEVGGAAPLEPRMDGGKKEILEERPPTGGLASKISPTSLEDLEAELERALAEEKGPEPLNIVKKPAPVQQPSQPKPGYKDIDPYREQVEEDLPNVRQKVYAPSAQNMERGKFSAGGGSAFGRQVSRTQPTPTPKPVEEDSPFSPIHEEKTVQNIEPRGKDVKPHDIWENNTKPNGALSKFRGINMQSLLKEQEESKAPETPPSIEQKPPPKGGKDPYKEPIN